jgi:hypothetical protein
LASAPTLAWQTFADLLDPPENPYVRDPVGRVTQSLGEFWWSGQHRMAQSVVENRYSTTSSRSTRDKALAVGLMPGHGRVAA